MQNGWGFDSFVDICHCCSYEPPALSPCNFSENGVPRGAHVPVRPGHDVRAGPGGAGGLRRAQDRAGGAALRPGEVRLGVLARPGPDAVLPAKFPGALGPPADSRPLLP